MRGMRAVARGARPVAIGFVGPVIALAAIAEEVGERQAIRWDGSVVSSLGHLRAEPLIAAALVLFSLLGGGAGLLAVGAYPIAWLVSRGRQRQALFVGLSVVGASALGRALKDTYARPRPDIAPFGYGRATLATAFVVVMAALLVAAGSAKWRRLALLSAAAFAILGAVDGLVDLSISLKPGFDSFPSGHATASMALTAALVVLVWGTRWRWHAVAGGAAFVAAVGLSRVSLGFHYASDVIAGWSLALAWVTVLVVAMRPLNAKAPVSVETTDAAPDSAKVSGYSTNL